MKLSEDRLRRAGIGALVLCCGMTCARACPGEGGSGRGSTAPGGLAAGTGAPATGAASAPTGTLESVLAAGQLRVLMSRTGGRALPREGSTLDLERQLLRRFAAELKVELEIIHPPSFSLMLPWLKEGRADLAVADLVITPARLEEIDFTIATGYVRKVLVGPASETPLADRSALAGKRVVVRPGSTFEKVLQQIRSEVPTIQIEAAEEGQSTQTLLEMVGRSEIPYTVSNSGLAEAVVGYTPQIKILLDLSDPQPLGWAVRKGSPRLLARLNGFISRVAMTAHRDGTYIDDLDGIRKRKVLRVLTRNNGVTYWLHQGQEVGFEYELAKAFAEKLGVRLEVVVPQARRDLIPWLREGRGDLIAAMLTDTPSRSEQVAFGAPYFSSTEVVVTREGGQRVETPAALAGKRVHVRRSSRYFDTLTELSATLPTPIEIAPIEEWVETEEVLRRLADGTYDITVAYSNIARAEARYEPRLVVGPEIGEPRQIAWAVRQDATKLKAAVDSFFTSGDYRPRGLMYNILHKRYLGEGERQAAAHAADRADRVGVISPYDLAIKRYSTSYQFDWRLIAAQMYQESRFDPGAKSSVGALGLMQLMPATARGLGAGDVRLPEPGIEAGVKYMRQLLNRFDPQLPFRQRYRFALASYNAGKGHVDDARILAEAQKLDPDRWFGHTERAMLLLQKSKHSRRARYGYCRGSEPVRYVSEIQSRYEAYSELVKE